MYLNEDNVLVFPSQNIDSFMFAEAPSGCARTFEGKKGKDYTRIGLSHVFTGPVLIPFTDGKKEIKFKGFDKHLWVHDYGAPRTKQGSLSIKQEKKLRPVLNLPWELSFEIELIKNALIDSVKLENWFSSGGIMLALGTWRPKFGRFEVKKWENK